MSESSVFVCSHLHNFWKNFELYLSAFLSQKKRYTKNRRIFADVIVDIFAHEHTTYLIEAVAVYMS